MAEGRWAGLMKIAGGTILDFLPNRVLRARFNPKRIQEGVHVFGVGYGPQFYVQKSGNSCSLETLNLKIANCLPFLIDLESIQASIVLEGISLGDLKQPLSLRIQAYVGVDLTFRQELAENQAD